MNKDEVIRDFFTDYTEDEKNLIFEGMGRRITPKMYKIIEKINETEKSDLTKTEHLMLRSRLLFELYRCCPTFKSHNPEWNFLLFTHGFSAKRAKLAEHISSITDNVKGVVYDTISQLVYNGCISPDKIELDGCRENEGVILNAQLQSGEWFLAVHENEMDPCSPYGHWYTFLSREKIDGKTVRNDSEYDLERPLYANAIESARRILGEDKQINHDNTIVEIGEYANRNLINNYGGYYDQKQSVDRQVHELLKNDIEI